MFQNIINDLSQAKMNLLDFYRSDKKLSSNGSWKEIP
ncbi:mCG1050964 [Mus musculus]|nr:mCG1050964 [Mus musculus]